MKTAKKVAIIISVAAICVGILISFIAMLSMDFDFKQLNTVIFETNTYVIDDDFTKISIIGAECDVNLKPSTDGKCKIECAESDKIRHEISVENGTLTAERIDDRQWYEHFGVYWAEMSLTVYLPKSEYDYLYIKSLSGEIKVPQNFTFNEVKIKNTSGDTSFFSNVRENINIHSVSGDILVSNISADNLKIQSTSGDIELFEITVNENTELKTVSGDIEAQNVKSRSLTANSTSGDIEIEALLAEEQIQIETVSGSIDLHGCDGANLKLKSTSGNVRGELLSEKIFITETISGDVRVPHSTAGGTCEIKTTSGNIHFEIE